MGLGPGCEWRRRRRFSRGDDRTPWRRNRVPAMTGVASEPPVRAPWPFLDATRRHRVTTKPVVALVPGRSPQTLPGKPSSSTVAATVDSKLPPCDARLGCSTTGGHTMSPTKRGVGGDRGRVEGPARRLRPWHPCSILGASAATPSPASTTPSPPCYPL